MKMTDKPFLGLLTVFSVLNCGLAAWSALTNGPVFYPSFLQFVAAVFGVYVVVAMRRWVERLFGLFLLAELSVEAILYYAAGIKRSPTLNWVVAVMWFLIAGFYARNLYLSQVPDGGHKNPA